MPTQRLSPSELTEEQRREIFDAFMQGSSIEMIATMLKHNGRPIHPGNIENVLRDQIVAGVAKRKTRP